MTVGAKRAVAIALVVAVVVYACLDLLRDPTALGTHDWDATEAYRWFVGDTIRRFGYVPLWDPHSCGGFPSWAAPESDTVVVSPFLPVYVFLPLAVAIRVEILATLALGLVGTWRLASRFTREPVVVALACVVGVMSSRWALHVGAGHCWHFYYAWLPWVVLAFMNATRGARRVPWLAATATILALMVYQGAIYPYPHTLLAIALYAAYVAVRERTWRPIVNAIVCAVGSIALAAPKLFPVAEIMARFPRTITSREYLWPHEYLRTLVWPSGEHSSLPVPGWDYAYHEYGLYIGLAGLAAVVVGVMRAPVDRDVRALRFVGLALVVLSFGAFGPWPLLHIFPPFRAQHVPTRFAYPGLMLLAGVAAAGIEAHVVPTARAKLRASSARVVAVVAALAVAVPIAIEARRCIAGGIATHLPSYARHARFEQTHDVPPELSYEGTNGPATLPVHEAGVGTIRCSTFHAYNHDAWIKYGGRPYRLGAIGRDDPAYRGEAYVEGAGTAEIARFSPDEIVVDVRGAAPGDRVVLNQNYDESWTANGVPTESLRDVNAHRLAAGESRVVFRYFPRTLPAGLAVAAAAALAFALATSGESWRRSARRRSRSGSAAA